MSETNLIEKMVDSALAGEQFAELSDEQKLQHRSIIVDVDGTLADVAKLLEFKEDGKLNWTKFFQDIPKYPTIDQVVRLVQIYYQTGFIIHIVTARQEEFRAPTTKWLQDHDIPFDFLWMRKDGDFREDSIIKKEILDTKLPKKELIEFVLDDRQRVVDMWRAEGLLCLQVNPHKI